MMTRKQARKAGYEINRGSYVGTTDDRRDMWYIQRTDANAVDRRGQGFRYVKDALQYLSEKLADQRKGE